LGVEFRLKGLEADSFPFPSSLPPPFLKDSLHLLRASPKVDRFFRLFPRVGLCPPPLPRDFTLRNLVFSIHWTSHNCLQPGNSNGFPFGPGTLWKLLSNCLCEIPRFCRWTSSSVPPHAPPPFNRCLVAVLIFSDVPNPPVPTNRPPLRPPDPKEPSARRGVFLFYPPPPSYGSQVLFELQLVFCPRRLSDKAVSFF